MVTLDTKVEELMKIPGIVNYCVQKGVSLITCSDVFPDTIGKLLKLKNVPDPDAFINDLKDYVETLPKDKAE